MNNVKTLTVFALLFVIAIIPELEKSYAQAYGGPDGKVELIPYEVFDFGIKMQTGDMFEYKVTSDQPLDFSLHAHDANKINTEFCISCPQNTQTYKSEDTKLFEGRFVATSDTNYYVSGDNTNPTNSNIQYNVTMFPKIYQVEYDDVFYDLSMTSNSQITITDFNALDKTMTLHIETPVLTEGFVTITLPKFLLGGPFELQIIPVDHIKIQNFSENETNSIIELKTFHGAYDITLVGTTAIPEIPFPLLILVLAITPLLILPRLKKII